MHRALLPWCLTLLLTGYICPLPAAAGGVSVCSNLQSLSDNDLIDTIRIYRCATNELDNVLPELHRRFPGHARRLRAVAAMYTGAPYSVDPLKDETENWLPYARTNCTLFVLYVTALAAGRSYQEAEQHMRFLHYRDGIVGFTTRYHFTADRISDPRNRYFTAVTGTFVQDSRMLREITLELNKKQGGGSFFNDRLGTWSRKVTLSYIPREGFYPGMLYKLPEVIGIALVKKSNWLQGIIIGHEGLLIDGDLYHASSSAGVCVVKEFLDQEFSRSVWDGMIFFSINNVSLPRQEGTSPN